MMPSLVSCTGDETNSPGKAELLQNVLEMSIASQAIEARLSVNHEAELRRQLFSRQVQIVKRLFSVADPSVENREIQGIGFLVLRLFKAPLPIPQRAFFSKRLSECVVPGLDLLRVFC